MAVPDWLSVEIAALEASLQGQGPTCQLDRQHATPASLKQTEGRYAILRRAARLLELGQSLATLDSEAHKARTALASNQGLARDPAWRAYFTGVLGAMADLARLNAPADPRRD